MEQLDTDSCCGTVPMELPIYGETYDTRVILHGVSCTITVGIFLLKWHLKYVFIIMVGTSNSMNFVIR